MWIRLLVLGAFALFLLRPELLNAGGTIPNKAKAEKSKTTVVGTWFRAQKVIAFFEGGEFIDYDGVISAASWNPVGRSGIRIATEAFGSTNGDLGLGGRLPILCNVETTPKSNKQSGSAGAGTEESLEIASCGDVGKRLDLVGKYARMEAGRESLIIGRWINHRTGRMIRFTTGGDYMDYDTILRWVETEGAVKNLRFGVIRDKIEPPTEEKPVVEVVVDDRGRELMLRRDVNTMEVVDSLGKAYLVDNYDSLSLNLLPGKWMLGEVKDKAKKEGKETGKVAVSTGGFGGSSTRICEYAIENQRLTLAACPRPSDNQVLMRLAPN